MAATTEHGCPARIRGMTHDDIAGLNAGKLVRCRYTPHDSLDSSRRGGDAAHLLDIGPDLP